jgi:hypothetical protein
LARSGWIQFCKVGSLPDFDDLFSGIEGDQEPGEYDVEPCKQIRLAAIAEPHPDQLGTCRVARRKFEEILVFADDHEVIGFGKIEDLAIGCSIQTHVNDVLGGVTPRLKKLRQSQRELVIDQELHATLKTA